MQVLDDALVLSASDLTGFAACAHLTQLELSAARGERERPKRDDPMLDVLSRRGTEHEEGHLTRLRDEGRSVAEIPADCFTRADLVTAQQLTVDAMRAGTDVIYQATFFDGRWRGHADFLMRVDVPSVLGDHSYEVADTKLARRVKAAALLQMCAYSEQVERLQGHTPEHVHVVTGDGESHPFRLADYAAYFRTLKREFEGVTTGAPIQTYPDPVEHCGICRWSDVCSARRRDDDHLSLVAGMRRDQTRKLVDAGVTTRAALAVAPADAPPSGINAATFERLRHQADLQVRGEGQVPPFFDLLPPEPPDPDAPEAGWPRRGWAALPEPSPGDLFFDMEGDPYALDGGLEYLFGVTEVVAGEPEYHAFWAHDRAEEKLAFEAFIDFVVDRRRRHPDLHVYHYASYEPTAVKRLMGAHGTREQEVDELLRGEVFVDLYSVVRNAVRVGTESYSLKSVEKLYMTRPAGAVMDAGSSIVAYEAFLDDGDKARLDEIEVYNADDCNSTLGLRNWLEEQRVEAEQRFGPIPRPEVRGGEASAELLEQEAESAALAEQLLLGVPDDPEVRTDEQQGRWLLAQMLDWHRREAKPDWWMYFARTTMSDDELFDDRESISGLTFIGDVDQIARSVVERYAFVPQDHKFSRGSLPHDPDTMGGAGEILEVDDITGTIDLKRGSVLRARGRPRALVPGTPPDTRVLQSAIRRVARRVIEQGLSGPGPYQSALDVLLRTRREVGAGPFDGSYLAVQGPPGSGKTRKGADLILDLVRDRKRVGITAQSHAVIGNLIEAIAERATDRNITVRVLQKADDHQQCRSGIVTCVGSNDQVAAGVASGEYHVIAGTAWLWAREEMADSVDVLFVDEAGQKSLADVIAVSGAAPKLVLLGDPQQLAQPSKGSHPDGAEVSALEHLLAGEATMPPDLGWFLETTYRMHPVVCEYVSEIAYEGRLHSEPGLENQAVDGFAGLRFVPVAAVGNRSWSAEEVAVVSELVRGLVGTTWIDKDGAERDLTLHDILIVTPYNAQVAKLTAALPAGARIGTVDKFQGQEAPVTIYSMATSSADDVPRSMEFLYDLHRMNVAVSRARAESIVVSSPELLRAHCRTPDQMRMVNSLCRYHERATARDTKHVAENLPK